MHVELGVGDLFFFLNSQLHLVINDYETLKPMNWNLEHLVLALEKVDFWATKVKFSTTPQFYPN